MKQVIVVNEALKLPRGKLAAQVAHAALGAFLAAKPDAQRAWLREGMPKIVLKAASDADLQQLEQRARAAGLPADLIHDAGHTVVAAGTITCLGLGPAPDEKIDAVTGDLKLV
jgi:peptidyl-tRNA hydrolase